jgi:formylmethanofuran dehydrogenase subunit C
MKSLGEHRDAESLDASRAILEQAKMEGGKIVLKQWGKGKFWVGRQIEGGGFQGPYLASGYYTSRVTVTYHDFSNRRG